MSAPPPVSLRCPPGTKMLLELNGLEEKLPTACVGHLPGRFVVAQMPGMTETRRDALYQMLYPDNAVIARYLHEGTVVGFSSRLIKTIQVPFPLIFLTYPKRLESHDLRKHPRVACCLPGRLRIGEASLAGLLMDISLSGCQFSAQRDPTSPAIDIDDVAELSCELFDPNEKDRLSAVVKRVLVSSQRLDIGLKFRDITPGARESLTTYLDTVRTVLY